MSRPPRPHLQHRKQDKAEYFARQAALAFQGYPGVWVSIADKLDNGRAFLADEAAGLRTVSKKWRDRYAYMDSAVVAPFMDSGRLDGHSTLMMAHWQGIKRLWA